MQLPLIVVQTVWTPGSKDHVIEWAGGSACVSSGGSTAVLFKTFYNYFFQFQSLSLHIEKRGTLSPLIVFCCSTFVTSTLFLKHRGTEPLVYCKLSQRPKCVAELSPLTRDRLQQKCSRLNGAEHSNNAMERSNTTFLKTSTLFHVV